jgi:hypothetical protein
MLDCLGQEWYRVRFRVVDIEIGADDQGRVKVEKDLCLSPIRLFGLIMHWLN